MSGAAQAGHRAAMEVYVALVIRVSYSSFSNLWQASPACHSDTATNGYNLEPKISVF